MDASDTLRTTLRADDSLGRLRALAPLQMDEVLWLARCLYSESDRPEEQRLVAWVVRNRVETRYRGDSYRDVVLEPRQFSAFNTPSPRRDYILSLNQHTPGPVWQRVVATALEVYEAPAADRPFPVTTRHFYSPVSMPDGAPPPWASGGTPLASENLDVDPHRFRFYDGVDAALDPPVAEAVGPAGEAEASASARIEARRVGVQRAVSGRLAPSGRVARPRRPAVDRPAAGQ